MSEIRAIETRYKGYRFRSRLEARWAVFFDALGIEWQYEPEGFEVGIWAEDRTRYLPDFFLPKPKTWVEVKGSIDAFDRQLLADAVDWGAGLPHTEESDGTTQGLLLLGPVPFASGNFWPCHPILQHHKGGRVNTTWFVEDTLVPAVTAYGEYFDSLSGGLNSYPKAWAKVAAFWANDMGRHGFCPANIEEAYLRARSARFEHGGTPR